MSDEFINSDTYGCGSGRYTGSRHWTYNPPYLEWGPREDLVTVIAGDPIPEERQAPEEKADRQ